MPCDTQDHRRDQNSKERKDSLKAPCSQVAEVNTAEIRKRNAKGESLLHVASRGGDLSRVKVLIASGADVNLKDNTGRTPLHEASSEGFNEVIIELLKAGANVNCENVDGMLPLHGAAVGNHLKENILLSNQKDISHVLVMMEKPLLLLPPYIKRREVKTSLWFFGAYPGTCSVDHAGGL
ncbi:Ankyrin repeat domain-containing protein 31, partial [Lemmus lemmus]